jgi:hypothetical protein
MEGPTVVDELAAPLPLYGLPEAPVFVGIDATTAPPVLVVGGHDDPARAAEFQAALSDVLQEHGLRHATVGQVIDLRTGVRAEHRASVRRILDLE